LSWEINTVVVLAAAVIAVITDFKERVIYRRLTVPLFISGMVFSFLQYQAYGRSLLLGSQGFPALWHFLEAWLGPVMCVAALMIFLFWLGILGGGDGHFLIAITPWLGPYRSALVLKYLFPLLFFYLLGYLLYCYKFNLKELGRDQGSNFLLLCKNLPAVARNIAAGEAGVLEKNIPYVTAENIKKPPAMAAILIAILLSFLGAA
jgi:Flp pilus assembly protein protease CpaA